MTMEEMLSSVEPKVAYELKEKMRLEYKRGLRDGANETCKKYNIESHAVWKIEDYDRIRKQNIELSKKNKEMKNTIHKLESELNKYKPKHNYSLEG